MDLRSALLRFGAARPHVLLAELPGGTAQRLAVECELRRRGWPTAASPAEADLLVLAGVADASLGGMVNRLWSQVPRPRAFARVAHTAAAGETLHEAQLALAEGADPGELVVDQEQVDTDPQECSPDHGADGDHGGEQDHGGGMEMPGGMAMADRGPDRDGLQLDQLHMPLGPFLPNWPAGLVVHTTIQGDLIQEAEPALFGADNAAPQPQAVNLLDSLARLLAVAGWDDAAARSRLLRDGILGTVEVTGISDGISGLIRRLRRARTLRWLTDGLGILSSTRAQQAGLRGFALRTGDGRGDVTARWMAWLDELERLDPDGDASSTPRLASGRGLPPQRTTAKPLDGPSEQLSVLAELLRGAELASARLIVASLDPELKLLHSTESAGVSSD